MRVSTVLRWALIACLLLAGGGTAAQDAPPTPECDPDLTVMRLLLDQAESQDDPANRLRLLQLAQVELEALINGCGGAASAVMVPTPAAAAGVPLLELSETLAASTFTLNYPAGWVIETPTADTVLLANSAAAAPLLNEQSPAPQPGQQAMITIVGGADIIGGSEYEAGTDVPLSELAQAFIAGLVSDSGFETEVIAETMLGDESAVMVDFSGAAFEAAFVLRQLAPAHYGLVAGVAAPGEREAVRPVVLAVAASIVMASSDGDSAVSPLALAQVFTSVEGGYTVRYPAEWVTQENSLTSINFANRVRALDALQTSTPALLTGDQLVGMFIGPVTEFAGDLDPNATLADAVDALREDAAQTGIIIDAPENISINDRSALRSALSASGVQGALYIFQAGQPGLIAAVIGLAAPGEYAELDPTVQAMAEALVITPSRSTGARPTVAPIATVPPVPTITNAIGNIVGTITAQGSEPTAVPAPPSQQIVVGETVETGLRLGETLRYGLELRVGDIVTLELEGDFDTTLGLEAPDGTQIAFNDDRGDGTLNSTVSDIEVRQDGLYVVVIGSYNSAQEGTFTLRVSEGESRAPHNQPGQAAPTQAAPTLIRPSATPVPTATR